LQLQDRLFLRCGCFGRAGRGGRNYLLIRDDDLRQLIVIQNVTLMVDDARLNRLKFYVIFRFDLSSLIRSISELFLNFAPDKSSLIKSDFAISLY
jgi:hypothetical protein